jgi:hypothetical protein
MAKPRHAQPFQFRSLSKAKTKQFSDPMGEEEAPPRSVLYVTEITTVMA